jgi:DeoR family transcriptional regulator of aga operon/DeoR family fructose operon transcriptional repressor
MNTSAGTRRAEIIEILERERYLKVAALSQRFSVSQVSILRDLRQLEEQGLLHRVHGGLIATPLLRLGLEISPYVAYQIRSDRLEKRDIARAAAALIEPGDHLIFDSGILSYFTACSLPGDLLDQGRLTVITNSLPVALELAPWSGVETILLGGEYRAKHMMNMTGPSTLHSLEGLHADKMFLTVDAIDIQHGVTIAVDEAELAHQMITACTKAILLATRGKIGRVEQANLLPISAVRTLVTSQGAPEEFVAYLRGQGTEVTLA